MKKLFVINGVSLCLLILIFPISCERDAPRPDSWQTVESTGAGNIILYYVPSEAFAYYNNDGILTGVTAEIFRDFIGWVENIYGYDINVQYISIESWTEFYNTVKTSQSGTFGMGNVTITAERRQDIDFSPPYMTNIAVLITHTDTPELGALEMMDEEFSHLDALAFKGTLHEERMLHFRDVYYPGLDLKYAYSNNEIIETVAADDRYFAYVDVYNYWRAREAGLSLRRHTAGDEPSEQFGFILPDNSDWTPVITRFFEESGGYLNSERHREIMETHLGTELANLLESVREI